MRRLFASLALLALAFNVAAQPFGPRQPFYPVTAGETAAGVAPTDLREPPGDTERYGGSPSASGATNKTALTNAIAANDEIYVGPGTYNDLTISASNKRLIMRSGVTIKVPNGTVDSMDTTGPAALEVTGSNVTFVGDFTVDGNRANNDSSGFAADSLRGMVHVKGDNARFEGELFVTGAYRTGFTVENGNNSGDEVDRLYIRKLRIYDPFDRAAMFWTVKRLEVTEIEVDIGTSTAWGARVRVGTQASSTGEASGHIGSVRTNGVFVTEPNAIDLTVDSVQAAGGKLQESERINIANWTADGSLVPGTGEAGNSFSMIICTDCHVGIVRVTGHKQTGADAVAFTQGNTLCSVDALIVSGTVAAVNDVIVNENFDLKFGLVQLSGTASGGNGFFYDHDADTYGIHVGALFSSGHSNAGKFDVVVESNLNSNEPIAIDFIDSRATLSIGSSHRSDAFSWSGGTSSRTVTNEYVVPHSKVQLFPRDSDAGVIIATLGYYVTPGSGSFQVFTGTGGNTAAQSEWDYVIYNGL